MKCSKCDGDFEDSLIQLSHDVPKYLFWDECPQPRYRHNFADKWGRRWLCEKCHKDYETTLLTFLKNSAKQFAKTYFKEEVEQWSNK